MKDVVFVGDSIARIRRFPRDARRRTGVALDSLQRGGEPTDWKPMKSIGAGVREIRIREKSGAYRIIYATVIGDAIHVLHAFQKKTRATPKSDLDLARDRLKHTMLVEQERKKSDEV